VSLAACILSASVGKSGRCVDHGIRAKHVRANACIGRGYFEVRNGWLWCEACGGLGRVMTPKAQLLLRGRVEQKFPGAGAA